MGQDGELAERRVGGSRVQGWENHRGGLGVNDLPAASPESEGPESEGRLLLVTRLLSALATTTFRRGLLRFDADSSVSTRTPPFSCGLLSRPPALDDVQEPMVLPRPQDVVHGQNIQGII